MEHDQSRIHDLTRPECLELLQRSSYVGRLGFVVDGHPVVIPVNYLADDASVTFCTGPGTKLSALSDGAMVAFEIDSSHPLDEAGWSVLVQGAVCEITDADELARLQRGPLRSWAGPSPPHWLRISIDKLSGRRIHSASEE